MPDSERPPLVILGHGLGGTREYGLEPSGSPMRASPRSSSPTGTSATAAASLASCSTSSARSSKVVAATGGARGIGYVTAQALPFRAQLALAHLTKADDVLSHIDTEERAAYVE